MTTTPATARDVLTREEAEARAARVSHTSYDLQLDLERGASSYRGDATIRFQITGDGDVFLDFRGTTIERLEVNGATLEPDWTGYRLTLPGSALAADNTVHVVYENEYDHGGDGLHQFVDPEDGEEYLYTNFEPYDAHRLFPCFDQPDIKATYALRVDAPPEWELISNGAALESEPLEDGRVRHRFAETERFSTYLFALIAGPYHRFRDEHNGIPLSFSCRKSLVQYVDADELFEVTKQGLDFYAAFFDYPYPFTTYDQIFVPEFNAGAMENVGAVTYSERLVFRDPPTETQRLGRAITVLHEMAHMWFGNLVTMRWWNDLWLNETFAEYMSHLAVDEATRFESAWQAFNRRKAWAYRQDELITTHPVAGEVADTDQTLLNFDGITYGKGAAVIKQLVATMGLDGFREGMRRYFRRHAFGNTTFSQFLDALQEGLGRDLHDWARLWLETPSLNTIAASWQLDGERLSSMTITQTALEQYPTLRPHHIEVALVREQDGRGGGPPLIDSLAVDVEGTTTEVAEAVGRPAPLLVMPNLNDHTFVKVALDPVSLDYVRGNLERLDDPLLRQLIWQSLWHMVRDQQLTSTDYLDLAAGKIVTEDDQELIGTVLGNAQAAIARYVPQDQRGPAAHRFFEVAREALDAAPRGDMQIIWARALIALAIDRDDIAYCGRLADGEITVAGLTVDQDMRWDIAARYVAYGFDGADVRVAAERERDPSDRGQRAALRCEVSAPDAEVKAEAWRRYHEEGYGSLHLTAAAMGGFHWYEQRELLEPYTERFFERVQAVFERPDNEFAITYFGSLFPGARVERSTVEHGERLLEEIGDRLPLLTRRLLEANDDLARAIKCREFAGA